MTSLFLERIGDGLSPASLAMHVGLGNQPPLGSSLHSSSHYFANFSGLGMNGESRLNIWQINSSHVFLKRSG